jgi:hypothetical protein
MNQQTIRIYVLDVPEFAALVAAARAKSGCRVSQPVVGYTLIESTEVVEFRRKELEMKPAVWYGLFTGGLQGRIAQFDRDLVRIVA